MELVVATVPLRPAVVPVTETATGMGEAATPRLHPHRRPLLAAAMTVVASVVAVPALRPLQHLHHVRHHVRHRLPFTRLQHRHPNQLLFTRLQLRVAATRHLLRRMLPPLRVVSTKLQPPFRATPLLVQASSRPHPKTFPHLHLMQPSPR